MLQFDFLSKQESGNRHDYGRYGRPVNRNNNSDRQSLVTLEQSSQLESGRTAKAGWHISRSNLNMLAQPHVSQALTRFRSKTKTPRGGSRPSAHGSEITFEGEMKPRLDRFDRPRSNRYDAKRIDNSYRSILNFDARNDVELKDCQYEGQDGKNPKEIWRFIAEKSLVCKGESAKEKCCCSDHIARASSFIHTSIFTAEELSNGN